MSPIQSDLRRTPWERLENLRGQLDNAGSAPEIASLLRRAIGQYLEDFANLHSRLSSHPIPPVSKNNSPSIIEIISDTCEQDTAAYFIQESLIVYLRKRKTEMTGLRAIEMEMFTPFTSQTDSKMRKNAGEAGKSWPIVEWTESDDTHNIAIFHFDEEQCSWIMHSGLPTKDDGWKTSRVDWNVSDVEHLKILFGVAQHTYGITEWDPQDILQIYCDREFGNCSFEEMKRRAKLLLDHLLKGKQLEHAFDQSKPLLEKIGRKQVSCDDCGDPVVRMGASVYLR